MPMPELPASRREFLKSSAAAAAIGLTWKAPLVHDGSRRAPLRIGLIGCGGRGTGAAANALRVKAEVVLVAVADVFKERTDSALAELRKHAALSSRVMVEPDHVFVGFDAARRLIASDVDVVILATPPHFRPDQFHDAVMASKHVFLEKPCAVDAPGVRKCLEAARIAREKKLSVVSGLQRHHQNGYKETIGRVHDGAIGEIVAARCYWNMGSLWMNPRKPEWSDMEWQLRNWLYFTWLSGDHIVEQHVHNIDVVNWAKHAYPVRAHGVGGRQVRTDPAFGHIFDHHSVHFEYADGAWLFSQCRQQDNCANDVSEHLIGTKGRADMDGNRYRIDSKEPWKFEGPGNDPYQAEHDALFESILEGKGLNEGELVANSTMTAIMGRMATYSGKVITWDEAISSNEALGPQSYEFGPLPVPPVAMPGRLS